MDNFNVSMRDGFLVRNKINNEMMNLTNKKFMDLNIDELQREIDYLWGQYDYVTLCEYLPDEIRIKKSKYLWNEIDALTTRYLILSFKRTNTIMVDISNDMKTMRKEWNSKEVISDGK